MKMILAVIFLVTATVSRAQNMCNTSYGAFTAMSSNCSDAVEAVIQFYVQFGPDPDDLATACSAECEALWRPVLTDCGSDISMGIAPISLICAVGPEAQSCYRTLNNVGLDNVTSNYVAQMISTCASGYAAGSCTSECQQLIMNTSNTFGCCWAEFNDVLDDLVIGSQQIHETWLISSMPALCGIDFTFCDGRPLPEPTSCSNAFTALYNSSCSDGARTFVSSRYTNGYNEIGQGMCPELLQAFGSSCLALDNDIFRAVKVFGSVLIQFNQASQCSVNSLENLRAIFSAEVIMENLVAEYGCCANEFARGFFESGGIQSDAQMVYLILTREIYTLCNIQSPGFCLPSVPPEYSESAFRCATTTNEFYAVDDFCTNYYREIYQASSVTSITIAAAQICINGQCINRFMEFAEYLSACDGLETGDDDSNIGKDLGFLSTILDHTSCFTNGNASCAAVILFSRTLQTVYSAFDEGGVCNASLAANRCSDECRQVIMLGRAETGCCFREFVTALVAINGYNHLQSICGLRILQCNDLIRVTSNPCYMSQEALLSADNCAVPFTDVLNVATGTVSGVTVNQLDQDLKTICGNNDCTKAVTTYLQMCASTGTDIAEFRNGFTCETSEQSTNCYALILSEPIVLNLTSAFISEFVENGGGCQPLLSTTGNCSASCRSLITPVMQNAEGCLMEIFSTILMNHGASSGVTVENIFSRCETTNPSGGGGAESIAKGLGSFVTLLLAVIAMMS